MSELPSVRVLLATFNGDRWLEEQIASLRAQAGVRVSVIASDDGSTDRTVAILEAAASPDTFVVLPKSATRFGNAHRNFMRLVRDAPLEDADWFAFSDQDDLWLPDKLRHAIGVLAATGADAYGADVTAFWPDGRRRLLVKSQPQRRFDHVFESAGPGCTFVFRRPAFIELQRWVSTHFEALQGVKVHDWLVYAYAREHGWRWIIDDVPLLLYRQHERNEAGANTGWRGALPRLRNVAQGRFRRDALAIGELVGVQAEVLDRLRRMAFADRLWLARHAREFRRSSRDAAVLALLFLAMPRRQA